eukprot:4665789-Alexandrium_andersonii.AAC.1
MPHFTALQTTPRLTELYGLSPPSGPPSVADFLQNLRAVPLFELARPGRRVCVRSPDDPESCESRIRSGSASAPLLIQTLSPSNPDSGRPRRELSRVAGALVLKKLPGFP